MTGIITILIGFIYSFQAYNLPRASVGNPLAPIYFPLGLGILMILFGIILFLQEIKTKNINEKSTKGESNAKLIAYTCGICILYALLFYRLGYVVSTFIFLETILFLINGKTNWRINTFVSLGFSFGIYVIFTKLFSLTLPKFPYF